jgi:hypothetical protein
VGGSVDLIIASSDADAKVRAIVAKDLLASLRQEEPPDPAELVLISDHYSRVEADFKNGVGVHSLRFASPRPGHLSKCH